MRPALVQWAILQGLPGWLIPTYFILVGLSTLAAFAIALHLVRRDGADRAVQSHALMVTYVAALAGGYVLESLRMLPVAVATGSLTPVLQAGRSAYGGLLFGCCGAMLFLRAHRQSIGAFMDRAAIGAGIVFCCVRTGCFLAGCDYGQPTAAPWGLRFPSGSLAALDHAQRGWVPPGFPSLPVHPTQLYEALLGIAGAVVAALVLRRRRRDGGAFLAFLAVYGIGRFSIELLRGDSTRGLYLGMSTAQYISCGILLTCGVLAWRLRSARSAPVSVAARSSHAGAVSA